MGQNSSPPRQSNTHTSVAIGAAELSQGGIKSGLKLWLVHVCHEGVHHLHTRTRQPIRQRQMDRRKDACRQQTERAKQNKSKKRAQTSDKSPDGSAPGAEEATAAEADVASAAARAMAPEAPVGAAAAAAAAISAACRSSSSSSKSSKAPAWNKKVEKHVQRTPTHPHAHTSTHPPSERGPQVQGATHTRHDDCARPVEKDNHVDNTMWSHGHARSRMSSSASFFTPDMATRRM